MGSITELAQAKMYKNFSTLISMFEKERLSATNLEKLPKKKLSPFYKKRKYFKQCDYEIKVEKI